MEVSKRQQRNGFIRPSFICEKHFWICCRKCSLWYWVGEEGTKKCGLSVKGEASRHSLGITPVIPLLHPAKMFDISVWHNPATPNHVSVSGFPSQLFSLVTVLTSVSRCQLGSCHIHSGTASPYFPEHYTSSIPSHHHIFPAGFDLKLFCT